MVVHVLGNWEVMGSNLGLREMDSTYIFVFARWWKIWKNYRNSL